MKAPKRSYLWLIFFVLVSMSLPQSIAEGMRSAMVASLFPIFGSIVDVKLLAQAPFDRIKHDDSSDPVRTKDHEIRRLLLENQMLGNEVQRLKETLQHEYILLHQMIDEAIAGEISHTVLEKHQQEILDLFSISLMHIPARVIFRPLNAWNGSLWIDKGEADNTRFCRQVIAKNSPVVIGTSVVGVVDRVGNHQSRVRLITDSGLNPSVRIKRGQRLLAKGEVQGESRPRYRSHQSLLKGVGFNYEFADDAGPARDLRTGEAISCDEQGKQLTMPLIQLNDLLVTTGMDGVFPPGLEVGRVKKLFPLKEGDFSYSLEAESTAGDLNALTVIFVLPPICQEEFYTQTH